MSSDRPRSKAPLGIALVAAALLLWRFPLFHVVPLRGGAPSGTAFANSAGALQSPDAAGFEAPSFAQKFWREKLAPAATGAAELKAFAAEIRRDPAAAAQKHGRTAGVGANYYFVRGSGKVLARERHRVILALDGAADTRVALLSGPVFGNTVRDGCGLLDVNAFPGLQEFNALAAELNALVEKSVQPSLREKAIVGAAVQFAGCAEAPESAPAADEPLLTLVPVQAEVR